MGKKADVSYITWQNKQPFPLFSLIISYEKLNRTQLSPFLYTGSCGGSGFLLNSSTITSPGYPTNYPPDLNCVWKIAAEEKQFVQFDLFDLHLESKYDVLKVYDGSCPYTDDDESDLVEEFTGKNVVYFRSLIILLLQ